MVFNVLSIDIGIKNFAICLMNKDEIIFWQVLELQKNCKVIKWEILIKKLHEILLVITNNNRIDKVFIEQQMTQKMKMLVIGVLMFFISKEIDCSIIHAKNKLKNFPSPKGKKNYNKRKKLAVSLTRFYLLQEKYYPLMESFNNSPKKDDLADSFLYCINYLC